MHHDSHIPLSEPSRRPKACIGANAEKIPVVGEKQSSYQLWGTSHRSLSLKKQHTTEWTKSD